MLKFLGWLLVPLLPLLGLLAGQSFKPEAKPRWQTSYGSNINVLGHVAGGEILLVVGEAATGGESLFGITTETGKTQFQIVLTNEMMDALANQFHTAQLSDDGKYVIFVASHKAEENKVQISLFDWEARRIFHRYVMNTNAYWPRVRMVGTTLAASTDTLMLWNIEQPDSPITIPWESRPFPLQLNKDASIVGQGHQEQLGKSFESQFVLYDIKNRLKLPSIHGDLSDICWAPDARSFTAIGDDPIRGSLIRRLFVRSQNEFKEVPEQDHVFHLQGNVIADQHFSVIASTEKNNPWRMKIIDALGTTFTPLMDRLWPDAQTLHLFDRSTATLFRKLTLPLGAKDFSSLKINSHPQGKGVALCDQRWIHYWDFDSNLAWYPILGLLIGLLCSTLLAWKLLRHSPRASKVPATT